MPRLLIWLVLALALGFAAVVGLLYLKQRGMIYFPQATRHPPSLATLELVRDGVTLRGFRVNPAQPAAIIYFGGNAEPLEHARDQLQAWFPRHTGYLLAYRGYGASDGEPGEKDLQADALALYDHIRARHPRAPVTVVGRSLGSGVAAYLAAARPVERLVLVTPFDSMAGVAGHHFPWLPVQWLLTERYESADHLRGYSGPVLVLRAGRDEVVPAASTDRLLQRLPQAEVVAIAQADHNDIAAHPEYAQALVGFIDDQPAAQKR